MLYHLHSSLERTYVYVIDWGLSRTDVNLLDSGENQTYVYPFNWMVNPNYVCLCYL